MTEFSKADKEIQPTRYALTTADFEAPPAEISDYKIGDRVSRGNFNSFLMQSFAISRGQPSVQKVFFMWLEKQFGFDFQTTMKAFVERGGWNALDGEEQISFKEAFLRVRKHTEKFMEFEHDDEILNELEALAKRPTDVTVALQYIDLSKISSIEEFNQAAAKFIAYARSLKK